MDMDTVPFSESFSGIIEPNLAIDDPFILSVQKSHGVRQKILEDDDSFDIERIMNIKDMDPQWDDDEIEEILVISPKLKTPTSVIEAQRESLVIQISTVTNFTLLRVLGNSSSAKVFLARNEATHQLCAVKRVRKNSVFVEDCVEHVRSEQACLRSVTEFNAPFLPRLHMSFQDEKQLYLAMDFYPGGDILTHLTRDGPFKRDRSFFCAGEIAEALAYLHSVGIVHRDLKPENVMIAADGHVVVTDFGFAKLLFSPGSPDLRTDSHCGTREYSAPEMLLGWAYDFAVDCWGFGVLLYLMHFGRHPFMGHDDNEHPAILQNKIVYGPTVFPPSQAIEPDAQDLITRCLERNPLLRLSIDDIKVHTYFDTIDWELVRTKQYQVPYLPTLNRDEIDLRYFEKEFLDMDIESLSSSPGGHISACADHDAFEGFSFTWDPSAVCVERVTEVQGLSHAPTKQSSVTKKVSDGDALGKSAQAPSSLSRRSSPVIRHIRSILKEPSARFSADRHSGLKHSVKTEMEDTNSCQNTTATPERSQKLRKRRSSVPSNAAQPSFVSNRKPSVSLSVEPSPTAAPGRNKLRKQNRLSCSSGPPPLPDLPRDIVQNGRGIGYTHTPPGSRSHISLSSIASKSCFASLASGLGLRKREKVGANLPVRSRTMIMQQIYGSSWSIGLDNEARTSTVTFGIPDGLGPRVDSDGSTHPGQHKVEIKD